MANLQRNYVRIAVSQPDGGVAIMQFITLIKRNEEDPGFVREATPENIAAELTKSGFGGMPWRIINDADIPQDRTYRNALKDDGVTLSHDPDKVKAIYLENHRKEAEIAAIAAEKQRLMASYVAPDVSNLDVAALSVAEPVQK